MAVAQLTIGMALAATEREGQSAGALLSVGGDARLTTTPDRAVHESARGIAAAPGVDIAVAGRVEDGIRASSRQNAASVRLVVVDAVAYDRLLAGSGLPDAPDLAQLSRPGDRVAALLLGGDPGLADELVLRWDDATVPLKVVGVAPRVGASVDPVVVVDAEAFADSGAVADPNTVWALGPGAVAAVRAAAGSAGSSGSVTTYADVLDARRDAPLAAGLTRLALASSALLLLFAVLGVVLAAATERPAREESLGRLRSLGVRDRDLGRILLAELSAPVLIGTVSGLALGVGAAATMFGPLALEQVTGQSGSPDLVVPWHPLLAGVALFLTVLVVGRSEARRLRRSSLAQLLRGGDLIQR
jgi:putative ABC transport system permease protein